MDYRRLNTQDILNSGILDKPIPQTAIPEDRALLELSGDEYPEEAEILEGLRGLKVVKAPNYYGIPVVWIDGECWHGVLLQYREVTEDKMFKTESEAVRWFMEKCLLTIG